MRRPKTVVEAVDELCFRAFEYCLTGTDTWHLLGEHCNWHSDMGTAICCVWYGTKEEMESRLIEQMTVNSKLNWNESRWIIWTGQWYIGHSSNVTSVCRGLWANSTHTYTSHTHIHITHTYTHTLTPTHPHSHTHTHTSRTCGRLAS